MIRRKRPKERRRSTKNKKKKTEKRGRVKASEMFAISNANCTNFLKSKQFTKRKKKEKEKSDGRS